MEQELVTYCKTAFADYTDGVQKLQNGLKRTEEECVGRLRECRRRYERLHGELEAKVNRARSALYAAEDAVSRAQARYERASRDSNSEDPKVQAAASREMAEARQDEMAARSRADKAQQELTEARGQLTQLESVWNDHYPHAVGLQQKVEASMSGFSRLREAARKDLNQYADLMERARQILNDFNFGNISRSGGSVSTSGRTSVSTSGSSSGRSSGTEEHAASLPGDLGWCPKHSMRSVRMEDNGTKTVTMTIGGQSRTYTCDRRGMASAYAEATSCGDEDMIPVTSAMFEIEDLRANLELTAGAPDVPQMGGYHRDVKVQDGEGYESHHIPAQSIQNGKADWLPTISISEEDHSLTPSYRGKSNHAYESFVPKSWEAVSYRKSMSRKLNDGSSGYIHALKSELLELRERVGNKYDGGISAFLDAVLDMLSTSGIPGAK